MTLFGLLAASNSHRKLAVTVINDVYPHAIPAGYLMKALLLFDIMGIAFDWRYIDHGSHLGGCLFGILCAALMHQNPEEDPTL